MLLQDSSGIVCDCCASLHRVNFTYYSIDIYQIDVQKNRLSQGSQGQVIFSLDVCPSCMSLIKEAIKVNYCPTNVGINCDLCNEKMRGSFSYYHASVTSVDVSMEAGTLRCKKCNEAMPSVAPCKCGSDRGVMIADVKTDDKFLQFVACTGDYKRLTETAVRIRTTASQTQKAN